MWRRIGRFNVVGLGGFLLQLGTLALLTRVFGWHYAAATAVAIEAAILHNFIGHSRWTWADRRPAGQKQRPRPHAIRPRPARIIGQPEPIVGEDDVIRNHAHRNPPDRRDAAAAGYQRWLPLINYENRQCGLLACKTLMKEGGVIASESARHPLPPLHPATRVGLIETARRLDPLVLRWGK